MGMLEDEITEHKRMTHRDERIKELETALMSCVKAMRDVQDHWGDPGCWTHNRLLTPLLIHSDAVRSVDRATLAAGQRDK